MSYDRHIGHGRTSWMQRAKGGRGTVFWDVGPAVPARLTCVVSDPLTWPRVELIPSSNLLNSTSGKHSRASRQEVFLYLGRLVIYRLQPVDLTSCSFWRAQVRKSFQGSLCRKRRFRKWCMSEVDEDPGCR